MDLEVSVGTERVRNAAQDEAGGSNLCERT